ncbi:MAG: hypothetical protein ACJASX_001848 [Limisphaerales bacterium]|jgi:hypothetical protein
MNPVHLLTLTTLLFAQTLHAAPWLVERGQAHAEIVVAEKPTRSARLGATELQTYLHKISGARLDIVTSPTDAKPIKIYVGESEASRQAGVTPEGLERDAFRIVSGPAWLALVGNDLNFQPREPWARSHNDWARNRQAIWEKLAGHHWHTRSAPGSTGTTASNWTSGAMIIADR